MALLSPRQLNTLHRASVNVLIGMGLVGMGLTGVTVYSLISSSKQAIVFKEQASSDTKEEQDMNQKIE